MLCSNLANGTLPTSNFMSQVSSSHSFAILFGTSICPTFRERERFPNEAEVRGRGYGVVIAHTSDHDHNDHDDGEDDHIDGEKDDNNDHEPFPRYGPAYLRPLRYAAPSPWDKHYGV